MEKVHAAAQDESLNANGGVALDTRNGGLIILRKKNLNSQVVCGKLDVKSGWVICPECERMKLIRLPPDGKVKAYVYCRHCRREQFLNID